KDAELHACRAVGHGVLLDGAEPASYCRQSRGVGLRVARRGAAACAPEVDLDRAARGDIGGELRARREPQRRGDEVRGDRETNTLVLNDRSVVVSPRVRDAVLGMGELSLQVQDVLAGLQCGVLLSD